MAALYECHGHIMMDGADFSAARERHRYGVDRPAVESALAALRDAGVVYFRDGGDAWGVSVLGRELAPAYGIEYVTPLVYQCAFTIGSWVYDPLKRALTEAKVFLLL